MIMIMKPREKRMQISSLLGRVSGEAVGEGGGGLPLERKTGTEDDWYGVDYQDEVSDHIADSWGVSVEVELEVTSPGGGG